MEWQTLWVRRVWEGGGAVMYLNTYSIDHVYWSLDAVLHARLFLV
jgi:hypothetical protein